MSESLLLKYHTIVVGGGIAGLYSAMKLADKVQGANSIAVIEASPRFGGRIETVTLDGFNCEFGPMRFELGSQPLLDNLLKKTLGLKDQIVPFPDFQTAVSDWPKYSLLPDEKDPSTGKDYNALQLTKLALIRIFVGTAWASQGDPSNLKDPKHDQWLQKLYKEDKYPVMRKDAQFKGVHLWKLGFWNVLSDVLSHQAVLKVRDQGNFYHLIPENPNAIEWIIFWLRGLLPKPEGQLYTLAAGSKTITERMLARLDTSPYKDRVKRFTGHELVGLEKSGLDELRLRIRHGSFVVTVETKHVILALPRAPLKKLSHQLTPQTQKDLDAVFGFPLLKVFFTAADPWWTETQPVHTQADRMPTRELHYYRKGSLGMIMLYTDRPNTEYWKIYVKGELHNQAEIKGDDRLKGRFAKYLAQQLKAEEARYEPADLERIAGAFAAATETSGLPEVPEGFDPGVLLARTTGSVDELAAILEAKLREFGIRDWSREPYGAACHTWRPGTQSAEVLGRLRAFRLDSESRLVKNVHVCGEAYCDYNGFIEGSLRSAETVVATIPAG